MANFWQIIQFHGNFSKNWTILLMNLVLTHFWRWRQKKHKYLHFYLWIQIRKTSFSTKLKWAILSWKCKSDERLECSSTFQKWEVYAWWNDLENNYAIFLEYKNLGLPFVCIKYSKFCCICWDKNFSKNLIFLRNKVISIYVS